MVFLFAVVKNNRRCVFERVEEDERIETYFKRFIAECELKNLSPHTIKYYERALKPFFEFLRHKSINNASELSKDVIDDYIVFMKKNRHNITTINTYLRGLRAFLNFLIKQEILEESIKLHLLKDEDKIKETYAEEDIKKLIRKPDLKRCSFAEYRNWVLVQYLLETGNRLRTVINIKVEDVDVDNGIVKITHSKNRTQYFSPISKTMCKILRDYIHTWGLKDNDYLFPTQTGTKMTVNGIQKAVRRYNEKRGVRLSSIHAFRHTFAKNYITSGGNPLKLKQLLGHRTLEVTNKYVRLYSEDLKKDFEEHSIIEKFYASKNRIRRV